MPDSSDPSTWHYDWRPTAREMVAKIREHIREHGEDAVQPILDTVAAALLEIDYPVPIQDVRSFKRTCATLVNRAAGWLRFAWQPETPTP